MVSAARNQGPQASLQPFDALQEAQRWPVDGLETVAACPVCAGAQRQVLHEALRDEVFACAPGAWTLHRCADCGCAYLDPRPTRDSIGHAYSNYYTHAGDWRTNAEGLRGPARLLRALANGYLNHRFGTRFVPTTSWGVALARLAPWRRAQLDAIGRHLPPGGPGLRILDVGCGNGAFLEFAAMAGWEVRGTDVDPAALAGSRGRGLVVHAGELGDLPDHEAPFDVITLSHVVEHLHEPLPVLQQCLRLLKPGGRLWIETPNIAASGHRLYGSHWRGLEAPRHLVLFHRASLMASLRHAGFDSVADLPWRPLCLDVWTKSHALSMGRDPYAARPPLRLRARALWGELCAWSSPEVREYLTLTARRPSEPPDVT